MGGTPPKSLHGEPFFYGAQMGRRPPNNAQNPPPRAEWWCRAEVRARRAPELPPADQARAYRALASARHPLGTTTRPKSRSNNVGGLFGAQRAIWTG